MRVTGGILRQRNLHIVWSLSEKLPLVFCRTRLVLLRFLIETRDSEVPFRNSKDRKSWAAFLRRLQYAYNCPHIPADAREI